MGQRDGIPPPAISTNRRRRHAALSSPVRQVVSRPVPPLPEEAGRLHVQAAEASEMSLAADRTNYLVNQSEFPTYAVTNAVPNQSIVWSLWLNDIEVVKDQTFGAATDNQGNWFGRGSAWTLEHVGFWVVLAKTAERQASVRFQVSADSGQYEPTPPQKMIGVTHVGGLYRFATSDSELTPEFFLVEGAKHIRNLGAQHVFAYLSPQYRSDYPFDDFGGVTYSSLISLAASPPYRKLFSLPFDDLCFDGIHLCQLGVDPKPGQARRHRIRCRWGTGRTRGVGPPSRCHLSIQAFHSQKLGRRLADETQLRSGRYRLRAAG